MKIKNIKTVLEAALILMICIFVVSALFTNKDNTKIYFDNRLQNRFNNNWKLLDTYTNERTSVNLPYFFKTKSRLIILEKKIPLLKNNSLILFRITNHEKINVFMNERLFFSSPPPPSLFKRGISSEYISIPLDESFSGKTLRIEILCGYNNKTAKTIQNVYLGEKTSVYYTLLKDNILTAAAIFLGIICSLFLVVLHFTFESPINKIKSELKGINYSNNKLLNIILIHAKTRSKGNILITAAIPFTISVWLAGESALMQIWIGNPYLIISIEYFAAMILPALLFFAISRIKNYKYQTISKIFVLLYILCIFLVVLLQSFKIMEFHVLTTFYYIPAALFTFIQFLLMGLDYIKNREKMILPFLITLLILHAIIIMSAFFYFQTQKFTIWIISLGLLIYMSIILYVLVHEFLKMVDKGRMLTYYEQMALNDSLTGLKSNIEYNIKTETLSKYSNKSFSFVVLDINDLKIINDKFGHSYGDAAIKKCAELIIEAFGSAESSYRIGGDEFVCILYGLTEKTIEQRICKFQSLCREKPAFDNYFLNVAAGYAVYDTSKDPHPLNAFKRADSYMYEDKKKIKTDNKNRF